MGLKCTLGLIACLNYNGTMIDVGAFSGGTCKKFVLLNWDVVAFEPNPERYQHIEYF